MLFLIGRIPQPKHSRVCTGGLFDDGEAAQRALCLAQSFMALVQQSVPDGPNRDPGTIRVRADGLVVRSR